MTVCSDEEMEDADGSDDFEVDTVEDDSDSDGPAPPRNAVPMLQVRTAMVLMAYSASCLICQSLCLPWHMQALL